VCNPIPGATAQTYTITRSDIGTDLYAAVTATNAAGAATATPQTALVVNLVTDLSHQPQVFALPNPAPSVPEMLRHGGVTGSYKTPRPGRLDIKWFAAGTHGKGVLVAKARAVFHRRGRFKVKTLLTRHGRAALAADYLLPIYIMGAFTPSTGPQAGEVTDTASTLTPIVF
jgi:hypothetical protein